MSAETTNSNQTAAPVVQGVVMARIDDLQNKLKWCQNEIHVAYAAGQERIADLLGQLEKLNEQWQYWRDVANTYAHSLEDRENKITQLRAEIMGLRTLSAWIPAHQVPNCTDDMLCVQISGVMIVAFYDAAANCWMHGDMGVPIEITQYQSLPVKP